MRKRTSNGLLLAVAGASLLVHTIAYGAVVSGNSSPNIAGRPLHPSTGVQFDQLEALLTPEASAQGNPNPGVHPVNSKPYGLSYAEWSARWWQWILSIPADSTGAPNPNLDATGKYCAEGQSGQVWFLAASFGTLPTPIDRTCTVPVGKSILIPILNQADGAGLLDCGGPAPYDVPCAQFTYNGKVGVPALYEEAKVSQDNPSLTLSLDGVPLEQLTAYRVQSPVFAYSMTTSNVISYLLGVFGLPGPEPAGTYYPAVSDGYWVMFTPLSAGHHTIHFEGVQAGGFATGGITYHLTIRAQD